MDGQPCQKAGHKGHGREPKDDYGMMRLANEDEPWNPSVEGIIELEAQDAQLFGPAAAQLPGHHVM